MNKDDLKKLFAEQTGITMKDVSYVLLLDTYRDSETAYKSLFDKSTNEQTIKLYDESVKIKKLKKYLLENKFTKHTFPDEATEIIYNASGQSDKDKYKDISLEENKEELIKMIDDIKQLSEDGELSKKEALTLTKDIRIRLVDKFKIDTSKENKTYVVVQEKYNDVCPYCHHEISIKK